ncbi:MAG: thiopurine S-methyltransferase [Gammaproteobacteria bacterium]|nr:thiopurine S-methyltransferase [Gammaproteobacteria bacterium]
MKPKFWLERWQQNQTGFHQAEHNKLLLEYWSYLELPRDALVFVPLCGKTLDMRWLEYVGHKVVGVELARLAIENFFEDEPEGVREEVVDRFVYHQGANICIYHGDFFDLTAPLIEGVMGLFDRGSLIALPPDMRFRYVDHILRIIPEGCRILLLTIEYDQKLVAGPPHSVLPEEVEALYGVRCDIQLLESIVTSALPPHFLNQGVTQAVESIYLVTKRD